MAKLQQGVNDLYTWCINNGERGQQLLYEFGNGDNCQEYIDESGCTWTPKDFTRGSNNKITWKCKKGHEWYATIHNRVCRNSACPKCSNAKAHEIVRQSKIDNGASLFDWCLKNGEYGQQILSEWTGIDENDNQVSIRNITKGSHVRMKWRCKEGHQWIVDIHCRIGRKRNCPYCSGRLATNEDNLYQWCSTHNEIGKIIIQEFTGLDKNNNKIDINNIKSGSTAIKIKWKCNKCGNIYYKTAFERTRYGGCFFCSDAKRLKQGRNDLYTWCLSNGERGLQLISEWKGIRDDDKQCKINEVAFGSAQRFLWKCKKCGHEWYTSANLRIRGTDCPLCNNVEKIQRFHDIQFKAGENDLYTWCINNGIYGQQVLREWTGIDKDGNYIDMNQLCKATQRKMMWKCKMGHEWYASIANRVYHSSRCPYCNINGTSYPEQFLYWSLKQIYPNAENRCRVLKSPEHPQGIEFDIGIPEPINGYKAVCIEYSPTYWHKDRVEIDILKQNLCKERNIMFIYIREDSYDELEEIWSQDYICFKMNYSKRREECEKLVEFILKIFSIDSNAINFDTTEKQILSIKNGTNYSNTSFENNYKLLLKEWHPSLNIVKPSEIKRTDKEKRYWQCPNCDYGSTGEWQAPPVRRTAKGYETGCPQCGYNWYKAQIGQTQKLKKGYTLNIISESEPVKMLPKSNTITKYNETKL